MKKALLIVAVAFASLTASAQTEQGKILVGGTVNFNSSKSDADDAEATNSLTIQPVIGYFVAENIAVGTGIGYQYTKLPSDAKSDAIVVSPFGRYYKSISDQFKFFGQLSVPMAFGTNKNSDGDKLSSSTSIGVALSPGFAFFPAKKFGIEFAFRGISYNKVTVEDADGNEVEGAGSSTFNIGANFFNPQIGFVFHF